MKYHVLVADLNAGKAGIRTVLSESESLAAISGCLTYLDETPWEKSTDFLTIIVKYEYPDGDYKDNMKNWSGDMIHAKLFSTHEIISRYFLNIQDSDIYMGDVKMTNLNHDITEWRNAILRWKRDNKDCTNKPNWMKGLKNRFRN